jgi:hypothetical protein
VPDATVVGDLICMLLVGTTPFVLRLVGEGVYAFVEACFVYDMMEGEGMALLEQGVVCRKALELI